MNKNLDKTTSALVKCLKIQEIKDNKLAEYIIKQEILKLNLFGLELLDVDVHNPNELKNKIEDILASSEYPKKTAKLISEFIKNYIS